MPYIVLYRDEFDYDVWEEYCNACGVSTMATSLKIKFNWKDVEEMYEEDDDYEDEDEDE